jgi:hypothetical protein
LRPCGWNEDAAALTTKLSRQLASTEVDEQIKHLFQMMVILCAAILIQYFRVQQYKLFIISD